MTKIYTALFLVACLLWEITPSVMMRADAQVLIFRRRTSGGGGGGLADKGVQADGTLDTASTVVSTASYAVSSGDLIVCGVKWEENVNMSSAADTAGNTYVLLTQGNNSGSSGEPHVRIAYSFATAGSGTNVTTITFASAIATYKRITCRLFTGATSFDVESAVGQATTGTAMATGSFTTSAASIIFAVAAGYSNVNFSANTIGGVSSTLGTDLSDMMTHWRITSGAQSSITANISQNVSGRWTTIAASFK